MGRDFTGNKDKQEIRLVAITPGTDARVVMHRKENSHCSTNTLQSAFTLELSGHEFVPSSPPALTIIPPVPGAPQVFFNPFTRLGRVVFDRRGRVRGSTWIFTGWNIAPSPQPVSGTYSIDSDCILTLKFDGITVLGTLYNQNNTNLIQVMPEGTSVSGILKRQ
jgi:hypothetical protein